MKKIVSALSALLFLVGMASCGDDSMYSGFKKMENGAYMKFYTQGNSEVMPRLKDEVTFEMAQYFDDSLLFTTADTEPLSIVLYEPDFVGDVVDGLLMMHVGDSARLVVPADSVFTVMLQLDEIPEEYAGKTIYYDLKLLSVKPFEALEAERRALLDSLKVVEETFLSAFRDDPNNTLTESGIIILEKTGKGKLATMGEYVNFDFTMCNHQGDTIMNSFGLEPVEIQYGEEFVSKGFDEAIGMVPEGGTLRCVIPSSLLFDSVGYEFILPYTPMVIVLKMNNVMDKVTYDKQQAKLMAEKEAEKNRLMELESKVIADYIKANGITESPTETGLYIIRQEEGQGKLAEWGDNVKIHFIIKNIKEKTLGSSYDNDEGPIPYEVGSGEMFPAIDEAVMTMAQGAKVTLISPSALAFGEGDLGEILPPYSPLIIELELVEIHQFKRMK